MDVYAFLDHSGVCLHVEKGRSETRKCMSMIEGVLKEGFVAADYDSVMNWAKTGSIVAHDIRLGLLRCGDDACRRSALRHRAASAAEVFRASPRQSDSMIVAGTLVQQDGASACARCTTRCLSHVGYFSMGSCANGGGYYHYSYSVVRGCDRMVSWSMCTCLAVRHRQKHLLYGILQLQQKIRRD